jgi:glycosyltransferase involved in cell wall biosynthesis
MTNVKPPRPLTIFVHRASECLTDHESHGEGLICFSLLNGLAHRGHQIYAFTNTAAIRNPHPNLHVKTARHRIPANSLAPWEYSWRAQKWLSSLQKTTTIDLVWHMNPNGGGGCPYPPRTGGLPLVLGPLYYAWPHDAGHVTTSGKPRLGIGIQHFTQPVADRGWKRTLLRSSLLLCATENHAEKMRASLPKGQVEALPLIVDAPPGPDADRPIPSEAGQPVRLLFVGNLLPNKRPRVFIEAVQRLRERGIPAEGVVLGDGPERGALEAYCAEVGMKLAVCFAGKVPNPEVYQRLREAHFLVSTSLGEPYGRGIAEAMAVGTPAVCHRSGGPADFITDGVDGLLVDELTGTAYADRIAQALSDPAAWPALSAAARRKAQDWRGEVVLDRLEAMLIRTARHGQKRTKHEDPVL